MSDHEERHGMKGWGARLGADLNEPKTREEATLIALLSCADRLNELAALMGTIGDRLHRLEAYVEEIAPGYTKTSAYGVKNRDDPDFVRAIRVAPPRGNHGGD